MALYSEKENLQSFFFFFHELMQTFCRNYLCTKSFIVFSVFFIFFFFFFLFYLLIYLFIYLFILIKIFIFHIVKSVSYYAKLDRICSLDAGFQQVPLVQKFWKFHNMVMEHHIFFKISEEKEKQKKKKIFSYKRFPKSSLL